jgi:hypothetical protein
MEGDSREVITLTEDPDFEGDTRKECPAWTMYWRFWKKNYPELKVNRPSDDICSLCYKFFNCHKFSIKPSSSSLYCSNITAKGTQQGEERDESWLEGNIGIRSDQSGKEDTTTTMQPTYCRQSPRLKKPRSSPRLRKK